MLLIAPAMGVRRVVGWWFDDWDALDRDNTRIWHAYYEPKPLRRLYTGWQEMLTEHRQIIVQVQEIAKETGWAGPESSVRLGLNGVRRNEAGMLIE